MYEEIRAVLEENSALLSHWDAVAINNYATLSEASIRREFSEELKKLQSLFSEAESKSPESIQHEFLELCRLRQARNSSTSLSYAARPDGDCNILYWEIAKLLFEPKSLPELLQVLLPDVRGAITVNTDKLLPEKDELGRQRQPLERVMIVLEEQDVKSTLLADIAIDKPGVLTRFVIADGRLFDVEQIQKFPFIWHQKLYEKLSSDDYASLKQRLYSHNQDLTQLQTNIQLFKKEGAVTLGEALGKLISPLISSGTGFTGSVYAADKAILACAQFRQYLDLFADERRKEIEALRSDGPSLQEILARLEKEGSSCVETAATDLKKILNDNNHARILQRHPILAEQQIKDIMATYGKSKPIAIAGFDHATELPMELKAPLLREIEIGTTEAYLEFLIALPEAEYAAFFEHVTIRSAPPLPENLLDALEMLTTSQVEAFFKAIIPHSKKFGGLGAILRLAVNVNIVALPAILESIPAADRLAALKEKYYYGGNTVLHMAALYSNPAVLPAVLASLSESDRLSAVKEKNNFGETVLHRAAQYPDPAVLQTVLASLSESDRLAAVKEKHDSSGTVLHAAARNPIPAVLQMVLGLYPESDRFAAVKERDHSSNTVLHVAARNPNPAVLKTVLALLSESDRLAAVKERDHSGNTVLHVAARNPNPAVLQTVLGLYPESDRLAVVKEKNGFGETVLHMAARNPDPDVLQTVLASLSESDRLAAVKKKDYFGETVLHMAARTPNPAVLQTVLALYPESDRLAAVKEKNRTGETVLHVAARNPDPDVLQTVLAGLPESVRHSCEQLIHFIKELEAQPNPSGRLFERIQNKKEEVNAAWALLDHLNAEGKVAWSEAEFKNYENTIAGNSALKTLYEQLKADTYSPGLSPP